MPAPFPIPPTGYFNAQGTPLTPSDLFKLKVGDAAYRKTPDGVLFRLTVTALNPFSASSTQSLDTVRARA